MLSIKFEVKVRHVIKIYVKLGDAAHQMPPWGGQGANTGIADVHNLAWKLAYVLADLTPPSLLSTYQIERHPIDFLCAQESADAADATGLIDTTAWGGIIFIFSPSLLFLPRLFSHPSLALL